MELSIDAADLVRALGIRAPQAVADEIVAAVKAKDESRIASLERLMRSVEAELNASSDRTRYGEIAEP